MSVLARLRRFWLDVHLWIGVGLLIPFAIIGVTGSLLVWHDPLERLLEPHRYEVSEGPSLPLAQQIESARAALDENFVVTGVRPPEEAGDPVTVQARKKGRPPEGQRPETRTLWLDPATAEVLDIANTRASAFGIMHTLHGSLMIPENGRKIVGYIGWAMLVSSLTGLWLWWPRNGAFLKGLRWKRGPRTTFNLHHFMGFWLCIPLAVLSLTGVYISFPQESRAVLGVFVELPAQEGRGPGGGGGPGGGNAPPLEQTNLTPDAASAAALAAAPGATLIAVNLPSAGRDGDAPSWRVQVRAPGAEANSTINVDDETGEARAGRGGGAPSTDQNVARLMRRIHDGVDMGVFWQTIVFLGGWAPFVLGITGIIMWLRRRAARRAIKRGHPADATT
jgi:uncharacterized iron-regulated membrane protein